MYFEKAVQAHKQSDAASASDLYQKAYQNNELHEALYQNYGALLRELGKVDEAKVLYEEGLVKYPSSIKISLNFANLLREINTTRSLSIYLDILRFSLINDSQDSHQAFVNVVEMLENIGCHSLAYSYCKSALEISQNPGILLAIFRIASRASFSFLPSSDIETLAKQAQVYVRSFDALEKAEFYFALAWLHLNSKNIDLSRENLVLANKWLSEFLGDVSNNNSEGITKAHALRNMYSWNMSCLLLPQQEFAEGWSLFEFGLVTPAKGKQKWQRALLKPFTAKQIPLWRGEILKNKNLLLLEEQAVGDVMQFLTLLPKLLEEASHVSLFLNTRLVKIFERSFSSYISEGRVSIMSYDDFYADKLTPTRFDYQSPLGSICRHRFLNIHDYGLNAPTLVAEHGLANSLRETYLNHSGAPVEKIVGISWRGGGRSDRIKQKSLSPEVFGSILRDHPGIRFVSLQYGESKPVVDRWRAEGIDVIHDDSINPLKDMDKWLSQVAACDAVLSIANTTIHGSGGLNIPTLCLLSQHSDWRWLKDPTIQRSYWYPSVGIAREDADTGWNCALAHASDWLTNGTPYPDGPYSILP